MSGPRPDLAQLAEATARAAFHAEHVPGRSNLEGERILMFDTISDFIEDIFVGPREQIAWALLRAEQPDPVRAYEEHERRQIEAAWKKIHEDAEHDEWERLGLLT